MTVHHGEGKPDRALSLGHVVAIVPYYNVGQLVVPVVRGLADVGCLIIVVDDGSTDSGPGDFGGVSLHSIRIPHNLGKGHAILFGLKKALEDPGAKAFAVLDGDGQHDPAELPRLVAAFDRENTDLLIGARDFAQGHVPFRSRFGNVLTVHALRWLLGVRLPDTQSGYRVMSRRFAEAVLRDVPGGRYETEMAIVGLAIRGGYKIASEPIRTIYEPGNRTSHFRKISDSFRVYRALLKVAFARRTPP
jgi:glycosyltransferase involved in cell wall biosynthesis